ncbi:hypothetical protein VTN00DRAFT_5251 [Thermoascus crustaceus]|uniref:uncharacterized protein n=1 Tax=Thermoascus crustaceus TaxID=5088 RepID=UPI003743F851
MRDQAIRHEGAESTERITSSKPGHGASGSAAAGCESPGIMTMRACGAPKTGQDVSRLAIGKDESVSLLEVGSACARPSWFRPALLPPPGVDASPSRPSADTPHQRSSVICIPRKTNRSTAPLPPQRRLVQDVHHRASLVRSEIIVFNGTPPVSPPPWPVDAADEAIAYLLPGTRSAWQTGPPPEELLSTSHLRSSSMAGNGTRSPQFLAPPAVTALRHETRDNDPRRVPMERSLSEDMRAEREDLREAAEQTLNIILDLDIDGRIKWVSPSWKQVVGSPVESVEGRMISDILLTNKTAFQDAAESMKQDDARSRFIRFSVPMGPDSVLRDSPESQPREEEKRTDEGETVDNEESWDEVEEQQQDILNLEAQGIMVFDRSSDGAGHTMWMLRPSTEPREVTIDLPPLLVESLGVGAEVLANYLTTLAESGDDPANHPPPNEVLCRICERHITPWWFEKHSELCLQEHKAEMDVQIAQENLNEHRHAIVKVLDALETRTSRPSSGEGNVPNTADVGPPEYKGLPIGPSPSSSAPSSGQVSASSSSPGTPPRSRDQSSSGLGPGHARARSFAVRRPLVRIVELILDLCDTALEISTPALKDTRPEGEDFRTLSPQSESRISQVLQWQSPSSNTLEQEQGLAALSTDTEQVAKAKVDAVIRHRRIVEYAERLRIEYTVLVEECIAAALSKAERIAAGQLSDSSSSSDGEVPEDAAVQAPDSPQEQAEAPTGPQPQEASSIPMELQNSSDPSLVSQPGRVSSVAVSTRSSSPMECPTPRSHKSSAGLLSTSQPSKRGSLLAESDAGENSDSSVLSTTVAGTMPEEPDPTRTIKFSPATAFPRQDTCSSSLPFASG